MTTTTLIYLIAGASFLSSFLVRRWLANTYAKWSRVPNTHGITGAQTAQAILDKNGVRNVRIEPVKGNLTDHYDPDRDILRLSATNYAQASVASMAVSAHEAGHAMQDAHNDRRLAFRRFLVPVAALGNRLGPLLLIFGFILGSTTAIQLGALLFVGMLVFQLATLPVEINASLRALRNLRELGFTDPEQEAGTRRVLTAAALTYVAAAVTSMAYLATLFAGQRPSTL